MISNTGVKAVLSAYSGVPLNSSFMALVSEKYKELQKSAVIDRLPPSSVRTGQIGSVGSQTQEIGKHKELTKQLDSAA